ncbi:MAG: GumC family protein [Bdellovibrionales bacterium]
MNQEQMMMMTDVREIWLFVRRNAKFIGLVTAAIATFAVILAFVLPARYVGEAVVMLDPRKTQVSNMESVVSGLPADNAAIRSEIDIIRSRSVMDRIINELHLMNDSRFNSALSGAGWLDRLLSSSKPEDVAKQEIDDRTGIVEKLLRHLEVINDGRSYSITIRYTDRDPAMAATIANAFADQYLVDQLEVKYDATQRANAWLSKRLDELRGRVTESEKAVENYRNANHLIGTNMAGGGAETITQQQLRELNVQLLQARAERSQADARLKGVRAMSPQQLETASITIASPLIQSLKQQEALVRRKVADLSTRYGDRHPMMIDAKNELAGIRDKIHEETQKIVAGLQNDFDIAKGKVASLEQELTALTAKTGEGNQAMVTLHQLEREAASNRSLYEGLLNRFKQVTEQQDLQIADARIIARADTPLRPSFPKLFVFLALGIFLGLAFGFMIALMLEYIDRGVRSLGMAEKLLGVTGLGIVPSAVAAEGQLPSDYVLKKPLSVYAESIRSVRAAIHFSNVDQPPKVIVVTSSFPGEGKTMFSTSFARILAKSGAKVLLIDADMRRPRVHSILSLDKTKPDLARVLADNAPLAEAIQKDVSGADVIIAHTRPPNPQDLVGSHQMEKLLSTVRQMYDVVIIDTPPVIAITDAVLIAKMADTTVYLARWASTPREVISEGLRQLAKFNIKLAGLVLTQVDLQDRKRYGYDDYGYYHGRYKNYYTN